MNEPNDKETQSDFLTGDTPSVDNPANTAPQENANPELPPQAAHPYPAMQPMPVPNAYPTGQHNFILPGNTGTPQPQQHTAAPYSTNPFGAPATQTKSPIPLIAMIVGIIAIPLAFFPFLGLLVAIVAIVLGAIALNIAKTTDSPKGMGLAGLITGIIALILSIVVFVAGIAILAIIEDDIKNHSYSQDYNQENPYGDNISVTYGDFVAVDDDYDVGYFPLTVTNNSTDTVTVEIISKAESQDGSELIDTDYSVGIVGLRPGYTYHGSVFKLKNYDDNVEEIKAAKISVQNISARKTNTDDGVDVVFGTMSVEKEDYSRLGYETNLPVEVTNTTDESREIIIVIVAYDTVNKELLANETLSISELGPGQKTTKSVFSMPIISDPNDPWFLREGIEYDVVSLY